MTTLIVGGGWSGLAAAITLCQYHHPVHLLESAKQLGGRARTVPWQHCSVDNGQHLMIGAYHQMLDLMQQIDIDIERAFHRYPLDIKIYSRHAPPFHLSGKHRWLPWPLSLAWNLISTAGFDIFIQIFRLQLTINSILSEEDKSVREWLYSNKQSSRLIKQLWEPLCLATLNTPISQASAHLFATVLHDSLMQGKKSAELLFPQQTLSELFPQTAQHYIRQKGGQVSLQSRVKKLNIIDNTITGVTLQSGKILSASQVILATPPAQTIKLLSDYMSLSQVAEYPITTVYLQYPASVSLTEPMLGMVDTLSQWVFDRGDLKSGLLAVVISGPGRHESLHNASLISTISQELHNNFTTIPAHPEQAFVIREKRATFAATVHCEQNRPAAQTPVSNLWLAGDYIANHYPATLEGAIRNGRHCAHLLLEQSSP